MTTSAKQGQVMLNFTYEDVVSAIQGLAPSDFYKSMPSVHGVLCKKVRNFLKHPYSPPARILVKKGHVKFLIPIYTIL